MTHTLELRLFRAVVGLVLLIPLVAGLAGALGGLEGFAALFHVEGPIVLASPLRNNLRAISWMFFAIVPLIVWTLRDMKARAGGFRIVVACGATAGFVRILGWSVDGNPGVVPVVIMFLELGVLPAVLFWHARLVRMEG